MDNNELRSNEKAYLIILLQQMNATTTSIESYPVFHWN